MIMQVTAKHGDTEVTIPAWLWGSVGAMLLLLTGGLGTWAGATLFDHEQRLTSVEVRAANTDSSMARIESGVERLNDKIDRLIERNGAAN